MMKSILPLCMAVGLLWNCAGPSTDLVGVSNGLNPYYEYPYGMVKVDQGEFTSGPNDQDVPFAHTMPVKTFTMHSFWMDQTEISNDEYRQFVYHVRDSIARKLLAENGVEGYEYIEEDENGEFLERPILDYTFPIEWDSEDELFRDALAEMYYSPEDVVLGRGGFDVNKWSYEYKYFDNKILANRENEFDFETQSYPNGFQRESLIQTRSVNVYPDTNVWLKDFGNAYTFNEPIFTNYFSHPGYGNYPVVGVSWEQANAFCAWRTDMRRKGMPKTEKRYDTPFRLPTEMEWEFAARGGLRKAVYPWGSPYLSNEKGCFLANFKPRRGEYAVDNYVFTAPVNAYNTNEYGLYNMSGNVSEWTMTPFEQTQYSFYFDLNPDYRYEAGDADHPKMKRKVIKGGSWKDIGAFLQISARDYEYQDKPTSFIGFRCVKTFENVRADFE